MSSKPTTPKGMRDFLPHEVARRTYIMDVIKTQFEAFGFLPIQTPSMERRDILLGKYGEEGDRLVFKVLNSGEKVKKADIDALNQGQLSRFGNSLSEKALRYDLTVPLARFVVQHQNELIFPFKRYQMQSVWRADRPQHGRFQEFTQCDADAIGSDSLLLELEYIQLIDGVFKQLNLHGCTLRVNHRKVLEKIAQKANANNKTTTFFTILDKLDKIGWPEVKRMFVEAGFSTAVIDTINDALSNKNEVSAQLQAIENIIFSDEENDNPAKELLFLFNSIHKLQSIKLEFDWTLARGLDYYTGAIFEIAAPDNVAVGSIGAGGRYDNLTAMFGMKDTSGIGISFGLDRIYIVLDELDLFPKELRTAIDIIVVNFYTKILTSLMPYVNALRDNGKRVLVYPHEARLKKQLSLANQLKIPQAIIVGETEWNEKSCIIKNLDTGEQRTMLLDDLAKSL